MYYKKETVMRSSKRGRESVCVKEREAGDKKKKREKTGGIIDKKEILAAVIREKKKTKQNKRETGSRQETWATED